MTGQPLPESANVTPIARYADRECSRCGIILPANQMLRVNDQVLTGYTKSTRRYSSTRGTYGSGGTTSERYRIEANDLCPACFERRAEAQRRSSSGVAALIVVGVVVVGLIWAFSSHSSSPANLAAAPSSAGSVPQDPLAPSQDEQQIARSNDVGVGGNAAEVPADSAPASVDAATSPAQAVTEQVQTPATQPETTAAPFTIDCSAPGSKLAQMVCANAGLRNQNAQISSIYRTLFAKAEPDQRPQFAREQNEWVSLRNACDNQGCLGTVYEQRLRAATAEAWTQYRALHRE